MATMTDELSLPLAPPRSPRKRWSPVDDPDTLDDLTASFYDDDFPPTTPIKRQRLERDSLSVSPSGYDSPFRAITPDDSFAVTLGESPMLNGSEFRQRYKKDELWSAIKSDYNYLMDEEIIETCKSTESDLSWDDDDIVSLSTHFSFAEFMQKYQEVSDWLAQTHLILNRCVTNNSERYLNQISHEEMLASSPRRKLFNDYGKQLILRYPSLKDNINRRMLVINDRWTTLQNTVVRSAVAINSSQLVTDLDQDLFTLARWLHEVECYLSSLQVRSNWTLDAILAKIKEHQVLQTDIESHSKQISSVLKLCEKLQDGEVKIPESLYASLQDRAVQVERRWHSIWLQSLEWQCRLEEAIKEEKGLTVRRRLHSSDPELWDSGEFGATPAHGEYGSDREFKNAESDSCADIIPFSADEYEKINGLTDDDRDHVTEKPPKESHKLRVSFSIDAVHLTSTPRSAESAAVTMMDPLEGDRLLLSFEDSRLQRSGKSESRDIGYSSEGYSNDEFLDNSPRLWKTPSLVKLQEWHKQSDNSEMLSSGFLSEDKSGVLQKESQPSTPAGHAATDGVAAVGKESLWRHSITSAYDTTSSNCGSEGEGSNTNQKHDGARPMNVYKSIMSSPPKQFYRMTTIETDFSTDRNDTDEHLSDLCSSLSPRPDFLDDGSRTKQTQTDNGTIPVTGVPGTPAALNKNNSRSSNEHADVAGCIIDGSVSSLFAVTDKVKRDTSRQRRRDLVTDSSIKSETDSRLDSSCEASGESNSDTSDSDEFSTASECGGLSMSVLSPSHLNATPTRSSAGRLSGTRSAFNVANSYKSSDIAGTPSRQRSCSGRDRPWSIVGFSLDDSDADFKPTSTSESAINGRVNPELSSTASTPNARTPDYTTTEKYGIYTYKRTNSGKARRLRKSKAQDVSPQDAQTANTSPYPKRKLSYKKRKHSCEALAANSASSFCGQAHKYHSSSANESEQGQRTLIKSLLQVEGHSSTSGSEAERSSEYVTPRESLSDISSDEESPLNITTFSENAWDNYQDALYPTVSEAPTEEPLHWEPPHDEFEFDDELDLSLCASKLTAHLTSTPTASKVSSKSRHKEKKQSYVDDDSDSDLDELHHMLQQSHDYLHFTTTSLHKRRTDTLKTGISMKPAKYAEHVMTCETNFKCLADVAGQVDSSLSELCEREMGQINDLVDQWKRLHTLAKERHLQSRDLNAIYSDLSKIKVMLDETITALQLGCFSDLPELDEAIALLQDKCTYIDAAWSQLSTADDSIDTFSSHNAAVPMEGFVEYATQIHKSWSKAEALSSSQMSLYRDSAFAWRSFVNSSHDITQVLDIQRTLLQDLEDSLGQQFDSDLSQLKNIAIDLAVCEDKLTKLVKLQSGLLPVLCDQARREMDDEMTRLSDDRLTLHHWCQDMLTRLLDADQHHLTDKLHDKFSHKKRTGRHAPQHFVSRLVKRATPVMFALVMLWLTSPEGRDSLMFSFSPELTYVRGPPAT